VSDDTVEIFLDGRALRVERGMSLAAFLMTWGVTRFRTSVSGEPRAPLCGMGVCHECRVTIDGDPHRRACLVTCDGPMTVETGARG
jgi:sarcosine oxidase subunit alpha